MKELNLVKILEGHEGETFYSPLIGDVKLIEIDSIQDYPIKVCNGNRNLRFTSDGKYYDYLEAKCMLFPSKEQKDWDKWIEYNIPKPKTWDKLRNLRWHKSMYANIDNNVISLETKTDSPIEKSALALMKIHQLIEVGYGGNISKEERLSVSGLYWIIIYDFYTGDFAISRATNPLTTFAFHTKEQAKKFISYPENVQLLKDYYMI